MTAKFDRRKLLRGSAATASVVGLGGLGLLAPLGPAMAADARLTPEDVRLTPDIERLVRLIEETPREKAVAVMVGQLKKGVSYRQFLAALFLAAARMKVSPHFFFMIHSAHQLSLDAVHEDRLLPLFWALLKLQSGRQPGPRYPKVNLALTPAPEKASAELEDAMRKFDTERAEAAAVGLCRAEGAKRAMGRLWHYAARDYSYIGHRAIAIASAWRTLETIGWEHAEPVFQFVVRQLNEGKAVTTLYRENAERAEKAGRDLPADWAGRRVDRAATLELLALLREGDARGACRWTIEALSGGKVQAKAVWDAIFLAAGELMVRYDSSRNIAERPLHLNTSTNALHFAFDACGDAKTRLYVALMAVEWAGAFIDTEKKRDRLRGVKITEIAAAESPASPAEAVEQIFAEQPARKADDDEYAGTREDMDKVCRLAFAFAKKHADHTPFLQTARRLICLKAENTHDVKFPTALFANCEHASPEWRPHLLAASVHWLHGTQTADSPGVKEAREALRDMK